MKFIIIGRNIDITEGLKSAVQEKLGKLERYFTPVDRDSCNLECGKRQTED